jgi:hypothetical protein
MHYKTSLKYAFPMLSLLALAACGGGGAYGGGGSSSSNGIVTSIVISPGSSDVPAGGMQQFKVVTKDSSGNAITGAPLTWMSSNPSVAKVTNGGLATAVAAGSATITASISYNSSGGIYGGTGMPITYTSNAAKLNVTTSSSVMGTAAVGHPLSGALLTMEDSRGQTQTSMTDADGHFLLSSAGMHAPFLIKAEDSQGRTLFGMGVGDGVANVTPVTDLMARAWFASHGSSADAAFADPAAHPAPDATALTQLNARFTQALGETLASQGFDVETFSFVSTSFDADGTGADHILDNISVNMDHGQMLLDDQLAGKRIEVNLDTQIPALKVSTVLREGMGSSQPSI